MFDEAEIPIVSPLFTVCTEHSKAIEYICSKHY
jgi:hypothetical protein